MGWDTQIIILVENIQNEEKEISSALYESDAINYFHQKTSCAKYKNCSNESKTLFFTYKRRKYLPYWTIQEVSIKYPEKYFTVIASCPDFILGPAGIIKVSNGEIIDSYGFWERELEATQFLQDPLPEVLYEWFAKDKFEEQFRELYIDKHPKQWIQELFAQNIIEFTDMQNQKFIETFENYKTNDDWIEIKLVSN